MKHLSLESGSSDDYEMNTGKALPMAANQESTLAIISPVLQGH